MAPLHRISALAREPPTNAADSTSTPTGTSTPSQEVSSGNRSDETDRGDGRFAESQSRTARPTTEVPATSQPVRMLPTARVTITSPQPTSKDDGTHGTHGEPTTADEPDPGADADTSVAERSPVLAGTLLFLSSFLSLSFDLSLLSLSIFIFFTSQH